MASARGENQDICGHIVSGTSTYPTPLSPSNHCVLAYSIVRKSPKRVAPYYEAPIRHESCQTTKIIGIRLILETRHKVIGKPVQIRFTPAVPPHPALEPDI